MIVISFNFQTVSFLVGGTLESSDLIASLPKNCYDDQNILLGVRDFWEICSWYPTLDESPHISVGYCFDGVMWG